MSNDPADFPAFVVSGELAAGSVVGPYLVEAMLGGGGMAKVYRVRHTVLGGLRALKVLNQEFVTNEEVRKRFLAEGQIQARLNHPSVVAVRDIVAVPGVAGLVMDLVDGQPMDDWVAGMAEPPPPATILPLFLQVLDAIGHAHRAGVIHRDIKPNNILVETLADGSLRPRIMDFGIAKVMNEELAVKGATRAGARMGTLHYMSPEQVRGAAEVTPLSDIYSLGATLYEVATRQAAA